MLLNSNALSLELIASSPAGLDVILNPFELYNLPLDDWISNAINFLVDNFRPLFQAIGVPISWMLEGIESAFLATPPIIFLLIIGLIAWQLAGRAIGIYSVIALTLIGLIGAWEPAMVSLSLVVTAIVFCILIGIPLGVLSASSNRFEQFTRPILDAMQTLPSFVYLVPVVMLFGIGEVPGVMATIVFALPPLIRLTNLGIRQVSTEIVEAAFAFGSTPSQVLWEAQIPLALPSILTGLNQAIVMALSMSVITSMIAVPGLGLMVLQGVGRLDVGQAAVGGLGIVLIAIMLDRITQAVGQANLQLSWREQGPIGFLLSRRTHQTFIWSLIAATCFVALLLGLITWQQTPQVTKVSLENLHQAMPGQGVTVQSAYSSLLEERFQTDIVNIGLEKLGYKIKEPKQIEPTTMYVALSNGDLDYTPINWEIGHNTFFENAGGEKKLERIGVLIPNTLQGYQIDKKTADQYNITSLDQLKDPKIAKLFDSDGDGKADLIGCNAGWFCEFVIDHHIDAYGLRDTVEQVQGNYSALIADTITRYKQGKPVLYHTWTPMWMAAVLKPGEDVIWLQVPFTDLPKQQKGFTEKDTSVDGKNLGFVVDRMRIVANKKFAAANPAAKRLFELIEIPIEDVSAENQLLQEGEDSLGDIHRHAMEWIENHQQLFDSWLEQARLAE